jgi:hypothetical protein
MVGTGIAFNTLPKRSVTALGNNKTDTEQDLDARRLIIIKIIRSRPIIIISLYPVTEHAVTSLIKKRN